MAPDQTRRPGDDTPHDSATDLAARIADGSHVEWPEPPAGDSTHLDPAMLEQLKAISAIADLRRVTAGDGFGGSGSRSWGHLAIVGRIGAGQFGEVFRAWDTRLQREVALKILHAPVSPDGWDGGRAIEEARHLARVRHPNVLTVYGAERIGDRMGIWTELIEGETLELLLAKRGPLPESEVVAIGLDLCRALSAVHGAGIVHRDVKAQNVMREVGGRVVLMDFGTGIHATGDAQRPGDLSGTPLYLAPEVFSGASPSVSTDLYALSVLLFHLLTGDYPVGGANLEEIRANHEAGNRLRLLDLVPDVSGTLAAVIERGLQVDPVRRFQTTAELAAGLPPAQPPYLQHLPKEVRPTVLAWATGAMLAVSLAAGLWISQRPTAESGLVCDNCVGLDREVWGTAVSPDGRWFAVADRFAGDLLLRDLGTGAVRAIGLPTLMPVFPRAPEQPGFPSTPLFAPDSRRLAFVWHPNSSTAPGQVWTVDVSNGKLAEVEGARGLTVTRLYDFAPDGQRILVARHGARLPGGSGPYELLWLSLKGKLSSLNGNWGKATKIEDYWVSDMPYHARVSPDGRTIAYAWDPLSGPVRGRRVRHIYLLDTLRGDHQRVVVQADANNDNPTWSPDGRRLLFTSDASGSNDLWSVETTEEPSPPTVVKTDLGVVVDLTITRDDDIYYVPTSNPTERIAVFSLGPPATRSLPQPAFERLVEGTMPIWSADGSTLRFYRTLQVLERTRPLWVETTLSFTTGHEQGTPVARGERPLEGVGDLTVEREDQLTDRLISQRYSSVYGSNAPDSGYLSDEEGMDMALAHRPVNDTLYAFRSDSTSTVRVSAIVAINSTTGTVTPVCRLPDRPPGRSNLVGVGIALSPDGQSLALAWEDKGVAVLATVRLSGCSYQQVYGPYRTQGTRAKVDWMPDGRSIVISEQPDGSLEKSQLTLVSAEGGLSRRLLALNGTNRRSRFRISPSGYLAVQLDPAFEQPFAAAGRPSLQLWRLRPSGR